MESEILAEGEFRRFIRRNGWEYLEGIHSHNVVVMIAVTPDKKIILVEQYRVPVGKNVIEFPAGLVNDRHDNRHESIEETAKRELLEETGYEGEKFELIREEPAAAALANDMMHVYWVQGLKKVSAGGGDETEDITLHEVFLKDIDSWLASQRAQGKMIDLKIYAGLYYLKTLRWF